MSLLRPILPIRTTMAMRTTMGRPTRTIMSVPDSDMCYQRMAHLFRRIGCLSVMVNLINLPVTTDGEL